MNVEDEKWGTIITSKRGWMDIPFRELWKYRDLILLFVRRDFVAQYKQTMLGPLWYLIQPICSTVIFTVVFGRIAGIPTDGLPQFIFYMAGITVWTYFANCLTKTSNTFISNATIFGKVYFPRLAVPISIVLSSLITFLIQFILFIVLLVYYCVAGYPIHPTIWILVTPLLIVQMAALGFGIGTIVCASTTRYRDLMYAVGFGVQLWMYATPIVYPFSHIPHRWQWLMIVNPMTAIVETFRSAYLGAGTVQPVIILSSITMTMFFLIVGIILFNKVEKNFIDTI